MLLSIPTLQTLDLSLWSILTKIRDCPSEDQRGYSSRSFESSMSWRRVPSLPITHILRWFKVVFGGSPSPWIGCTDVVPRGDITLATTRCCDSLLSGPPTYAISVPSADHEGEKATVRSSVSAASCPVAGSASTSSLSIQVSRPAPLMIRVSFLVGDMKTESADAVTAEASSRASPPLAGMAINGRPSASTDAEKSSSTQTRMICPSEDQP